LPPERGPGHDSRGGRGGATEVAGILWKPAVHCEKLGDLCRGPGFRAGPGGVTP
jgi:hypothetical protein